MTHDTAVPTTDGTTYHWGREDGIYFNAIRKSDSTRLDLSCEVTKDGLTRPHELWFKFSEPVLLTDDAIAIAMATLCGRAYDRIEFDLSPSAQALRVVSEFTRALEVTTTRGVATQALPSTREGHVLSFSGGLDSLAALSLMPDGTKLVSMDFGGRFARERKFFEKFSPITVETNLLDTDLHTNSWSFMGIGAILTSGSTRAKYHTFGSILEAGADNMSLAPLAATKATFPPFRGAGYLNAAYVAGLTEIGTIMVALEYQRGLVQESLDSLANPGEEKFYRKQVLTKTVARKLGVDLELELTGKPAAPHYAFGQNFALDLLSLYVVKHAGIDAADELVRDIPVAALALSEKLDLTFFERANTTLYQHFPRPLLGGLVGRLAAAGVSLYTEADWLEYAQVRDLLRAYHPKIRG